MRAVVLLSGGLDSATVLGIALSEGYRVWTLTFDYGQKHRREIESAQAIASYYNCEHKTFTLDLAQFGGSALFNGNIPSRRLDEIGQDIPRTYVPARNTIFLSIALAYAEILDAEMVFIGANATDYSGYPDCRAEYIQKFRELAQLATRRGVRGKKIDIRAPLLHMKKSEIVRMGYELGVPYHLTWSCYRGGKKACGNCDACLLRLKGFREAGIQDPIEYEGESDEDM